MPLPASLCKFPIFSFSFSFPAFPGFTLPSIPIFSFNIDLSCPLN